MRRPRRALAALAVVAAAIAGCSGQAPPPAAEPTIPAATVTSPPAPSTTAPTAPPVSPAVSPRPGASGLGDRLYPWLGNGGYDVESYLIEAAVDPAGGSISATATITAVALHDLSQFNLDFTGPEVAGVLVDGEPARFRREDGELVVDPGGHIPGGEPFEVEVTYAGVPAAADSPAAPFDTGWHHGDGAVFVLSQPDGARAWFPANDHPQDRADVVLDLEVPPGMVAVSSGPGGEVSPGRFTYRIDGTVPYLVPLAVGRFEMRQDGELPSGEPIVTWYDAAVDPGRLGPFARQRDIIDFFAERFGPYPYDTAGSLVVASGVQVALETQALPTYTEAALGWGEPVVAHEIAHQWFGNRVAVAQWDDIWLNEGLATFAQWLWQEHRRGHEAYEEAVTRAYGLISGLDLVEEGVDPPEADRRARQAYPPPDDPRPDALFTSSVYRRGGLAMVALRDRVGDETVFRILTEWVGRHGGGAATTEDFLALTGELAGPEAADELESWVRDERIPAMPRRGLEPPG